jgi:hypothetical protein
VEIVTIVVVGVYIKIFIPNYFRCEKYNIVSLFPNSLKEKYFGGTLSLGCLQLNNVSKIWNITILW